MIADTELNIGGVKLKGVYIALVLSIASTIGGGLWATAEFFNRIDNLEAQLNSVEIPDLTSLEERVNNIESRLEDQNIGQLQGKLAELGTNLTAIMEAQKDLMGLKDRVASVEKSNSESLLKLDAKMQNIDGVADRMDKVSREIDDLWSGLDAVANPLK